MNDQNKNTPPQMIEMPEYIKATLPESTRREFGRSVLHGTEPIPVDRGPGIPVENPSPAAIRRAGTEVMIDGKVGYMLPGQSVESDKE